MTDMFGFQVDRYRSYATNPPTAKGWNVHLPHSCDHWQIAEDAPKAEAADSLRSFIAEASRALEFLESAADDWDDHYGPQMDYRWDDEDV